MADHIKTWAKRPGVQLWGIYLSLVLLGALSMLPIGYWATARQAEVDRMTYEGAIQRASDSNKALIFIINNRLPEITRRVDESAQAALDAANAANSAAKEANEAAKMASGAGGAAKAASGAAKSASIVAREAAIAVKDAVDTAPTPEPKAKSRQPKVKKPALKEAPKWLDGP